MDIRYLGPLGSSDPALNGWLTDVRHWFKSYELIEYTKVEYLGSVQDPDHRHLERDKIKPLEGIHKGKEMYAPQWKGQSLFLKLQGAVYNAPAIVYYHNTRHKIWIGGGLELDTDDPDFSMGNGRGTRPGQNSWLPPGDYNLRIPEYPSGYGRSYAGIVKNPMVWFPVANGNGNTMTDRFLHPGQVSYGCVSVKVKPPQGANGWEQMYNYLIRSRLSDLSVGTLRVYGSAKEPGT